MGELVWQMDTMSKRVMGQIVYTSSDDTKESSIRVRLKSDGKEYDYQHTDVKTETGLCGLYVCVSLSFFVVGLTLSSLTYRYDLAAKHLVGQKCTFMTLTHPLKPHQLTQTHNHRYRHGNHKRVQHKVTTDRT